MTGSQILDTLGQKCPQPILKLAVKAPDMSPGQILEIWGDSDSPLPEIEAARERVKTGSAR